MAGVSGHCSLSNSSGARVYLLAYIIAPIDLMVLRKKYPAFARLFKAAWFPFLQLIGIAGMFYTLINNSPSPALRLKVYINAALFIGGTGILLFAG